jgi:hypothetical protein
MNNARRQRLVAVHVTTTQIGSHPPTITPVTGESLEELLLDWRIVQLQGLGSLGREPETGFAALLLLEEIPKPARLGGLGFAVE